MVDQTAPLLRRELLIDEGSGMRLCTPQLQLRRLHVGSPEWVNFGLWPERVRSAATKNPPAGAGITSRMQKPGPSTRAEEFRVVPRRSQSKPQERRSGCRPAGPTRNA